MNLRGTVILLANFREVPLFRVLVLQFCSWKIFRSLLYCVLSIYILCRVHNERSMLNLVQLPNSCTPYKPICQTDRSLNQNASPNPQHLAAYLIPRQEESQQYQALWGWSCHATPHNQKRNLANRLTREAPTPPTTTASELFKILN